MKKTITAFERATNYLGIRSRTVKEMHIYLVGKGYSLSDIAGAIEKLLEYGYLNDSEFASEYVESYKHKYGPAKIRHGLIRLGVERGLIDVALEDLGEQREEAESIAERYLRGRELDYELKQKLTRHLASKGFCWDTVKAVSDKLQESKKKKKATH